ncbi:hypothetical protein F5X96DRAFT_502541 [Biscogniauxia mediterranea]|nr:hypothetical protein F5X96DRAFT_502541 [Biscogniauxia mediterranea]
MSFGKARCPRDQISSLTERASGWATDVSAESQANRLLYRQRMHTGAHSYDSCRSHPSGSGVLIVSAHNLRRAKDGMGCGNLFLFLFFSAAAVFGFDGLFDATSLQGCSYIGNRSSFRLSGVLELINSHLVLGTMYVRIYISMYR